MIKMKYEQVMISKNIKWIDENCKNKKIIIIIKYWKLH